jgi:hypothetical protein
MAWVRLSLASCFFLAFGLTGCGVSYAPLRSGSVAGRAGVYNYSPSVLQSGNVQQIWWCGFGGNPKNSAQISDTISYVSIDLATQVRSEPVFVLAETPGAWDSVYTCNPKVIGGSFLNPLGNGENFTYAMYYVGLGAIGGGTNAIGVAFSRDGVHWEKYPNPVILPQPGGAYGVGQPAVHNEDGGSTIRMFYESDSPYMHHEEAISKDGVHFTGLGTLTTNGLLSPLLDWGDMAYEPQSGDWYAAFNTGLRDPSTTGTVIERGQYGVQLYRIPNSSVLTGATPWQFLGNIDTAMTGYEANFLPGFIRDLNGNLFAGNGLQMSISISDPAPSWKASPAAAGDSGDVRNWEIASVTWTMNQAMVPLNRYFNQTTHEVTTGWVDPKGGFVLQSMLGHLYQTPQQGATVPFYGCKNGSMDYFVSLDVACEGARILGTYGYAYSAPTAGAGMVRLYRCFTGHDHFVSTDPGCEGETQQETLGFVVP